jgi:hypothetical protein
MKRYKNVVLLLLLFTASLMSSSLYAASTHCLDSKNKYATPDAIANAASCQSPTSKWQETPTEDDKLFCFSIHQGKLQASQEELLKCKVILDKSKQIDDEIKPQSFDAFNRLKQWVKPSAPPQI